MKATIVGRPGRVVEKSDVEWKVKADFGTGKRLVAAKLPLLMTVTRELNAPRRLSFSGIIKARKKEITTWTLADLALGEEDAGQKGSPTIVGDAYEVENTRQVEIITGELDEKVDALVHRLVDAGVLV